MKRIAQLLAQFWNIGYEEAYELLTDDFVGIERAVIGEYCSDRDSYTRTQRELAEQLLYLMEVR
jgi:hypothetical protein